MTLHGFDPDAPAGMDDGIYGLQSGAEDSRVILVPVPFEATVSYGGGAARGPDAILRASRQVDLYDLELGRAYEAGIHMCAPDPEIARLNESAKKDAIRIIERAGATRGDVELELALGRVNDAGAALNEIVYETVRGHLAADKIVGVLGGDHSVSFGAIRAHAEKYGEVGILHLDAHADLRRAYEGFTWSHASIMERVAALVPEVSRLVQIGIRDVGEAELALITGSKGRITTWVDPLIARARARATLLELFREAVERLPRHVYLSFDIDGLDPRLCPNTGTPVPGGLDLGETSMLLEQVVEAGRTIVGFDLVEVAPGKEGDEWDGNVAARLLYKMIGWTLRSRSPVRGDHRALWERLAHTNVTSRTIV